MLPWMIPIGEPDPDEPSSEETLSDYSPPPDSPPGPDTSPRPQPDVSASAPQDTVPPAPVGTRLSPPPNEFPFPAGHGFILAPGYSSIGGLEEGERPFVRRPEWPAEWVVNVRDVFPLQVLHTLGPKGMFPEQRGQGLLRDPPVRSLRVQDERQRLIFAPRREGDEAPVPVVDLSEEMASLTSTWSHPATENRFSSSLSTIEPSSSSEAPDPGPILLPEVYPRPQCFYRVQHSAAFDEQGIEIYPPSRTYDSEALGLNASIVFRPGYAFRITKENIERALDPMNQVATSLVALYESYARAIFDFTLYDQVGCQNVYIVHIATEKLTRGTVNLMMVPPGKTEAVEVRLPAYGTSDPWMLVFSVLSCMEFFEIETEMSVTGVWFAIDGVPPKLIVRREAKTLEADWTNRDEKWMRNGPDEAWEEWGMAGRARFGVDGTAALDPLLWPQMWPPSPTPSQASSSSPEASDVWTKTENDETPGTTRSPEVLGDPEAVASPGEVEGVGFIVIRESNLASSVESMLDEELQRDTEIVEKGIDAVERNLTEDELSDETHQPEKAKVDKGKGVETGTNLDNDEMDVIIVGPRSSSGVLKSPSPSKQSPRSGPKIYDKH